MKALSKLILAHQPPSGVYWIGESVASEELENLAAQPETTVCHIRGAEICTMAEFLEAARRAADAPEECGYNIDMFRDCMRTFASSKAVYITVYDFIEIFATSNVSDFAMVIETMIEVALAWDETSPKKRLYSFLSGDTNALQFIRNDYRFHSKEKINNFWHLLSLD